uniref:Uncharacterized protein n=1 Tax=Streptomyces avermitilis TaxID=33903 RepID=A0A499VI43_STRAX|nr:hypothetical protein SAVMC3_46370 [Streptomyces avermitilis]
MSAGFVSGAGRWGLVAQFPAPLTGLGPGECCGAVGLVARFPAPRRGSAQVDTAGRWGLVAQFPAPLTGARGTGVF